MSEVTSCCRVFPDECKGCPDYVEEVNTTLDVALAGCFGFYTGPAYAICLVCMCFRCLLGDPSRMFCNPE